MEIKRRKFQGVLNILSFNRHFYITGLSVLALLLFTLYWMEAQPVFYWLTIAAFAYGLLMPLIISAYVYDFSGYYEFQWLKALIGNDEQIKQVVNINAGFDETSFILKSKLPKAELNVFDFYNANQHTEPAIVRARKVSLVYPNTRQIASDSIPLPDHTADIIFLLSAAHEIRSHEEKVTFLKECYRVCKPEGKVIMVEHLRDFSNFLAFSVGFTHFFSSKVWRDAFSRAGFILVEEKKFTPFMSVFNFTR